MKDETAGRPVHQFVGLRAKMYSLKYDIIADKEIDEMIEKQLKHETYKECLFQQTSIKHEMNFIRSHRHELFSITVNKTSLSPYDDKRYVMEDGIHTLAHGHYKICNI